MNSFFKVIKNLNCLSMCLRVKIFNDRIFTRWWLLWNCKKVLLVIFLKRFNSAAYAQEEKTRIIICFSLSPVIDLLFLWIFFWLLFQNMWRIRGICPNFIYFVNNFLWICDLQYDFWLFHIQATSTRTERTSYLLKHQNLFNICHAIKILETSRPSCTFLAMNS